MKILGIETSCDETAAGVVENGNRILSNVVSSSAEIHAGTGGIIPENAARQQIMMIIPVISRALKNADLKIKEIDAIAVTVGPGLIGSLLVGVETAKTLSILFDKPIVPVNHLLGHIYANWLEKEKGRPDFPLLALVVSGGHTDLVYVESHDKYAWVGGTRDDAAGEAFDKTARLLSLPYPGGPSISKAAEKYSTNPKKNINLPRPMINENNFDFSFSGLKTAVLREVQTFKKLEKNDIFQISHETQEAISEVLIEKSIRAVKKYKVRSFLLGGGVSANKRLAEALYERVKEENLKVKTYIPIPKYCTDNAVCIAACAYYIYKPKAYKNISAQPELSLRN